MTTLRELGYDVTQPSEGSPLELWLESIRDVPIDKLGANDLARALRQRMGVTAVLPYALAILDEDPQAGDHYDGALLWAILEAKGDALMTSMDRARLARAASRLLDAEDSIVPDEKVTDIKRFLANA